MKPQTRNWFTAIFAITLLIILATLLGALYGRPSTDPVLKRPSTFFTDDSGARALLLVMKSLLPSVEQWRRPLDSLSLPSVKSAPSTLIVAGPGKPISEPEAKHLDKWLSEGGQLILATDDGWPLKRRARPGDEAERNRTSPAETHPTDVKEIVTEATYLSRHARGIHWSKPEKVHVQRISGFSVPNGALDLQWTQKFASVGEGRVIASAGDAVLAVEIPIGKGRIVAIADPTMISNRALRAADNAVWLVTVAAGWGNQKILVDEYHHGFGQKRSAAALTWAFVKTPWGWSILQMVAAGLLYLFGYRRRFGRISESPPAARTSVLELVDARAGIFQAAAAQPLAVELIIQNLAHELAQACGKPLDISQLSDKLAALDNTRISAEQFRRLHLLSSKATKGEKLTDQEFVEVGRIAGELIQGSMTWTKLPLRMS
jgi:hypothetical protein